MRNNQRQSVGWKSAKRHGHHQGRAGRDGVRRGSGEGEGEGEGGSSLQVERGEGGRDRRGTKEVFV